ncbi:major facilitator superfamily domain-containing protein 6 [Eupeodes corollae]|uniref:major facilitator superfamily domain-containing protein 6 n=1 Tax=Eupeodes corollae TaxID=290404 RepID=UPI002491C775|nr:major facilitator superfamily domain-containing protein 6 [Eupeodes corollae]XP_055920331.1 major facilitator superfamily domain-containing protein 6 [Eupeodes corollae]XP_055920332.1 major facilitator superfamily domain-containing protein 6 [Eupeodes corollae]XP_055920333.1 major facilitator superfamily domain-containing protein 6 [Eupeodes corollae]XP_055920334.1 major facilitator superfamily domain-containing protein 6 [Eupeodes corollae]XP_055920335.1 major facilitator superfamily domai
MVKINEKLLPIKAHYFFFMAAMGPILPQISVYGKQLGVEPEIMGYITSVLPIMYVLAKPVVGFLADYFANFRKCIFISLIFIMTLSFAGFYFVPATNNHSINVSEQFNLTLTANDLRECGSEVFDNNAECKTTRRLLCNAKEVDLTTIPLYITRATNDSTSNNTMLNENIFHDVCHKSGNLSTFNKVQATCKIDHLDSPHCLYKSSTFWIFVILLCLGTIGFNVTNSISDAICFDVLEGDDMQYGGQRVWGTIGFGFTALLAGIFVDIWTVETVKSFIPALVVMLVFSGFDLLSVTKLKLPNFSSSDTIFQDIWNLLSKKSIAIFLVFTTIAGIIDSFIIYFMFWHLEDVALETGYMEQIKLIEGCVVAAECLCGEIPIFLFSGKILKKIGYVHCLSLCFFTYFIRLGLISLIVNPWWLVPIEMVMQGCTYALCYTCIVAYASAVAPAGTSATVQGLVAGMDDGLGFAIGSLIGGQLYKRFGGRRSFQMFSGVALVTCFAHILIRPAAKHKQYLPKAEYQLPVEMKDMQKS